MKPALIYLTFALLAGLLLALLYICCIKPVALPHGAIEGQELIKTKRLMKKHGVNVLYEDYKGVLWFKRDGRMVKA